MHWKTKARIQKVLASLPAGVKYPLYFTMQRRFGSLKSIDVAFELRKGVQMMELLAELDTNVSGKSVVEIGVGRTLNMETGLWLCGANRFIGIDLNPYLEPGLIAQSMEWFRTHGDQIRNMFAGFDIDQQLFNDRLQSLNDCPRDLESVLALMGVEYLAPIHAFDLPLEDDSIDYHISTNVLEHVPPEDIRKKFREARRLLKPAGLMIHRVDPTDHFSHSDPEITSINFLQFSQSEWDSLANNTFSYHNRLRVCDFQKICEELKLEVLAQRINVDARALAALEDGFPINAAFERYTNEELAASFFAFAGRFQKSDVNS